MKNSVILTIIACLVLSPCLAFAAETPISDEIASMNAMKLRLDDAGKVMYAKCWQTCADSDYGKLNCVTTCDDGSDSGGSSGDGNNFFSSPEGLIIGVVLIAGIVAFVWYMADQSNAAYGV